MSVTYKPVFRANPRMQDGSGKYYPQLIVWGKSATLDSLAEQMAYASSLTKGDIKSVLTNFVTEMRRELYNGHSVNIDGFGVFSLSAQSVGVNIKLSFFHRTSNFLIYITRKAVRGVRPSERRERSKQTGRMQWQLPRRHGECERLPDRQCGNGAGTTTQLHIACWISPKIRLQKQPKINPIPCRFVPEKTYFRREYNLCSIGHAGLRKNGLICNRNLKQKAYDW